MASGKKQYVISTTAWGKSFKERYNIFKAQQSELQTALASNVYAAGSAYDGPNLYSIARQKQTMDFYRKLMRPDDGLKNPDGTTNRVDPIRVFTNRIWSVKGRGEDTKPVFLSGAMTLEAEGEVYNSQPFDIVFSNEVTKTGDGVLADSIENVMLAWRDQKNGDAVASGLFPVYQENIKLLPVESTFNQYYMALTGVTPEQIADADEKSKEPQYGQQYAQSQVGSIYQKEGSVWLWNQMRHFIGAHAQVTKAAKGISYEDYSSYVNVPFNKAEAKIMSFDGTSACAFYSSEYNFYSQMYETFASSAHELLLPCMLLQQAADSGLGDVQTAKIANDNISLGGSIKAATCGNVTSKKKKSDADPAEAMTISSAYWNEFGAVLAKYAKMNIQRAGGVVPTEIGALARDPRTTASLGAILKTSPAAAAAAGVMRNMVFSGDYGTVIADTDNHRENYPMHAEISFTADHFAQFSDHINDAGLMPDLIDSLIASEDDNERLTQDINSRKKPVLSSRKEIYEAKPTALMEQRMDGGISLRQIQKIRPLGRKVLDVEAWLYKVLNNQQDTQKMTGRIHAHANGLAGAGMTNSLEKQIKTIIALGKVKDMVADYVRKYSQILKGEPAYAETVVYQVRKSMKQGAAVGSGSRQPGLFVQNFWFSNSSDITNIDFIDTQVHYGKEYIYEIYAHTLVIGTRYDIGNKSLDMSADVRTIQQLNTMLKKADQRLKTMVFKDASFSQAVWYTPALKIVKTRIFTESVLMFDSAPIVPEVEFVPYKGNNHMLLCIFKGSVGRERLPTIQINTDLAVYGPYIDGKPGELTEQQAIDNQIKWQKHEMLDNENLLYESDDRPDFFEVYRTTKAPYSYSDFDGKMVYRVGTKIPSEKTIRAGQVEKFADSATMKEIIMPNRKYYYTVRQVDVHGNFSNPTPVYEVEMVDQQGMVYPIIKEYRFKDPIPKTNRKYFNKHIKIAPSVQQVLINTGQMTSAFDAVNGSVQLGVSDANVWGKKYKIRITSTTTGKSADLNVDFNQKHKKTTTEIEGTDAIDKETGVRMKTQDITAGSSNQNR